MNHSAAMKDCITYHSAVDGTRLAVAAFRTVDRGPVVLLLHGIASHMGWYAGLARTLQAGGLSVYLLDRRGVARSEGARGHVRRWTVLIDDVIGLAESIERQHPAQPLHVIGISLGGAIAVACAVQHPGLFRSIVLLSPALASSVQVPLRRKLLMVGRALAAPGSLVDLPFALEQLTSSAKWREALQKDQRRTQRVSARFLLEVLRMQRYIRRRIRFMSDPILALFAGRDEIIDNDQSIRLLMRIQAVTVRVEVFTAVSHLISASVPAQQLADRLLLWLRGDHGSSRDRFSLLRTIVSHEADDIEPPHLDIELEEA